MTIRGLSADALQRLPQPFTAPRFISEALAFLTRSSLQEIGQELLDYGIASFLHGVKLSVPLCWSIWIHRILCGCSPLRYITLCFGPDSEYKPRIRGSIIPTLSGSMVQIQDGMTLSGSRREIDSHEVFRRLHTTARASGFAALCSTYRSTALYLVARASVGGLTAGVICYLALLDAPVTAFSGIELICFQSAGP